MKIVQFSLFPINNVLLGHSDFCSFTWLLWHCYSVHYRSQRVWVHAYCSAAFFLLLIYIHHIKTREKWTLNVILLGRNEMWIIFLFKKALFYYVMKLQLCWNNTIYVDNIVSKLSTYRNISKSQESNGQKN